MCQPFHQFECFAKLHTLYKIKIGDIKSPTISHLIDVFLVLIKTPATPLPDAAMAIRRATRTIAAA